jgi:proteic killer suppression protein
MIKGFRDSRAKALFEQQDVPALRHIERAARRKLEALDSALQLGDLAASRGNNLEALKGTRLGQHSIRINDQYRICFVWHKGDASDVEIVDLSPVSYRRDSKWRQ